jgi:hypothetical protein
MARVLSNQRILLYSAIFILFMAAYSWDNTPALAQDQIQTTTIPPVKLFLPAVTNLPPGDTSHSSPFPAFCPQNSTAVYQTAPVIGLPLQRPAEVNPDINLSLRGYISTPALPVLVDYDGDTDSDAPQLPYLFQPTRLGLFSSAHQVYDWDWSCGTSGCRSGPITSFEVTLLGLQATAGEAIYPPGRKAAIYSGGFVALVLYAEPTRVTLAYTREDSPAVGYIVHLEEICIDPNLLALYRLQNEAGRTHLPALHNGEALGTAQAGPVYIAVRDTGSFMDPRARKDWWQGH